MVSRDSGVWSAQGSKLCKVKILIDAARQINLRIQPLLTLGDDCAVAESVKAASDIYAPVSGEIVAVNDALSDSPELVNSEPYAGGWIFKIKASDESELESLLDATAYEALLEDE
ncbi:hypothetical protein MJL47_10090 [Salmonella enterica subsp. enterica serovar Derby]|nr:hypothetical protein [Salmonella enterica subsp. enterica serovar Derby]